MELWTSGAAAPRGILRVAQDVEAKGWDGLSVVDSQNLSGDPFVALALAATVTQRLKLGTGVTNSITRNAAVLATAIASVHSVSRGRAVLGIGRGDSALAHLGRAPARLDQFERFLRHLQAYLSGQGVPFDEIVDIPLALAPPLAELHLAEAPADSRIAWIACACHPNLEMARHLVLGNLTVHARFGVMHGTTSGPLTEHQRTVMQHLRHAYDMRQHTQRDSAQAAVLTAEFIDQYAAVGTPERIIAKLQALEKLGITKCILGGSRSTTEAGEAAVAKHLIETEVLPVMRK
jgi:alkanesulfonate monooxygenase SsuD/methylene tetrahydromethanopterin reductase-like flavin-dependent oxidoreductase (luciferase family)